MTYFCTCDHLDLFTYAITYIDSTSKHSTYFRPFYVSEPFIFFRLLKLFHSWSFSYLRCLFLINRSNFKQSLTSVYHIFFSALNYVSRPQFTVCPFMCPKINTSRTSSSTTFSTLTFFFVLSSFYYDNFFNRHQSQLFLPKIRLFFRSLFFYLDSYCLSKWWFVLQLSSWPVPIQRGWVSVLSPLRAKWLVNSFYFILSIRYVSFELFSLTAFHLIECNEKFMNLYVQMRSITFLQKWKCLTICIKQQ